MMEQRAIGGSPVTQAAQQAAVQGLQAPQLQGGLQDFIGGQLQPGQDLNQFSQFAGAGQMPGGGAPGQVTPGLANVGAQGPNAGIAGVGQGMQYGAANQQAGVGPTQSLQQAMQPFQSQVTGLPGDTQQALAQTAQGQSLQGNPYLDQQFDIAAQRVTDQFNREISPGIAAQFSQAGRTGSDAQVDVQTRAAGEVSDSLAQLANQVYGGNYQRERDRQLQAAGQLGSLSQAQQGLGLQAAGQGTNFFYPRATTRHCTPWPRCTGRRPSRAAGYSAARAGGATRHRRRAAGHCAPWTRSANATRAARARYTVRFRCGRARHTAPWFGR